MAVLEWQDKYSVGNSKMDGQHKGLIALINALDDDTYVRDVMDKLGNYVDVHFREEEKLLEQSGYPDLDEHLEKHKVFEDWFTQQKSIFETGDGSEALRQGIQSYLKVWLMNHIMFTDKSYSKYVA